MPQALRQTGSNRIIKLIVAHWLLGALTGVACAGLLLLLDVAHLRTLLLGSDVMWIGLLTLCASFALTFGGVIAASAVMMVPHDE